MLRRLGTSGAIHRILAIHAQISTSWRYSSLARVTQGARHACTGLVETGRTGCL